MFLLSFFFKSIPFCCDIALKNCNKNKSYKSHNKLTTPIKWKEKRFRQRRHPEACDTLTQEVTPFLFAAEQEMTRSESQLRSEKKMARSVPVMWSENRNRAQGSVSNSPFSPPQFQLRINHWAFRVLLIREDLMGSHHCEVTIRPLDIRPDVHFNPHQSSKAVWRQRWKRLKI